MLATFVEHDQWYDAFSTISNFAKILYSYNIIAYGFSASLTPTKAQALESLDGILSILPKVCYKLHTTQTLEFLDLDKSDGLVPQANIASNVMVGDLNTMLLPHKFFMSNPITCTVLTNLLLIY